MAREKIHLQERRQITLLRVLCLLYRYSILKQLVKQQNSAVTAQYPRPEQFGKVIEKTGSSSTVVVALQEVFDQEFLLQLDNFCEAHKVRWTQSHINRQYTKEADNNWLC